MKKLLFIFSLLLSMLTTLTVSATSESFTVNGVTFKMKSVEGGTFNMGGTPEQGSEAYVDEFPVHQVTLSSFAIGETEVTQALWTAVMGNNPSEFKNDPNNPVEQISWDDCQSFINKLNEMTGKTFRLPTEAEWEYAARGGNRSVGYKYSGSNNIFDVAWFNENSNSTTHPVATKMPNELDLYDMSGNVFEWCLDWNGTYTEGPHINPTGPASGRFHITRGGAWLYYNGCSRVSFRSQSYPLDYSSNTVGLRLAMDAGQSSDQPIIEVSTTEINFGVVKKNTDKQETFTVTNISNSDVTFMVDASTEFTYRFEVSDNLVEFTLHSGESKVFTATSHGMLAGWSASTNVFVKNHNGEIFATIKLKAIGDDDRPLVDQTSLTMMVGERLSVYLKTSEYVSEVDNWDVVDYIGGGPGTSGGLSDGHDSEDSHSSSGLTFTALKPGVAVVTIKHKYTDEVAILTITVLDPAHPTTDRYAIYNYRNDGDFSAFLNMDVDSITYSKIDLNGMRHPNVVVQEVWTPDSVYRIPLASIDSIAFKAPEPVYKPDVYHITSWHFPYVVKAEGLSLYMKKSIAADSIPAVGQVVISDVIENPLQHGFSGRVLAVETTNDSYIISCEPVALTDIFERLLLVGRSESFTPEEIASGVLKTSIKSGDDDWDGVLPFELGKFKLNIPSVEGYISNDNSDMTLGSLAVEPKFYFNYLVDIKPFVHSHVKVLFENRSKTTFESHLKVEGNSPLTETKKSSIYFTKVPVPIVPGILYGEVALGGELYLKGNLDLKAVFSKTIYNGDEYEWDTSDFWNVNHNRYDSDPRKKGSDVQDDSNQWQSEAVLSVNGSFGFGLSLDLILFAVSENTLEISNTTSVGPELSGSLSLSTQGLEDGTLYSALKDTKVSFTPLKLSDDVKFNICMRQFTLGSWSHDFGKKDYRLFPDFTAPDLPTYDMFTREGYKPLGLYTSVTKNVLPIVPLMIGIGRYDAHGNLIDEQFASQFYQYENDWNNNWLQYDITNLPSGTSYTFHPLIRIWGARSLQLKAMPAKEIDIPSRVSLEESAISVQRYQLHQVAISGGWGDYEISNNNPAYCDAVLKRDGERQFVQLMGKAEGTAIITLKDVRSGEIAVMTVQVAEGHTSPLYIVEQSLDIGEVPMGTTQTGMLTIVNNSPSIQTVTVTASAPFALAHNESSMSSMTIDVPSNSCSYVNVAFTAFEQGNYNGTITFTNSAFEGGQCVVPIHAHAIDDYSPQTEIFTVNGVSFKMVTVDGGTFMMGATPEQGSDASIYEKPAHQVSLSNYSIGETEVTQALWVAVMGNNPSYFQGDLSRPVEKVSWDDSQLFISKLNDMTGMQFRLPTEAEWEYAARGGKNSNGYKYAGSNNLDDVAWYGNNSGSCTHSVATKLPNELGIYDMSGNVWEWVQDWYGNFNSDSQINPEGPPSGPCRVDRGGNWIEIPIYCRVSYRDDNNGPDTGGYGGLRLAMDVEATPGNNHE